MVEFRLLGRILLWQQRFGKHVLLKFELLVYFVGLIELWCLRSSILITLNTIVLRNMTSQIYFSTSRCVTSDWWCHTLVQIVKSGEWRHNSLFLTFWIFSFPVFVCVIYFRPYLLRHSLKIYTKLTTIGMQRIPRPPPFHFSSSQFFEYYVSLQYKTFMIGVASSLSLLFEALIKYF